MIEVPTSSNSRRLIHMFWKHAEEPRMEPPIQEANWRSMALGEEKTLMRAVWVSGGYLGRDLVEALFVPFDEAREQGVAPADQDVREEAFAQVDLCLVHAVKGHFVAADFELFVSLLAVKSGYRVLAEEDLGELVAVRAESDRASVRQLPVDLLVQPASRPATLLRSEC